MDDCALPSGRCVVETTPRPLLELHTIVPLQQSYPLDFLAEIRTTEYVNTSSGLTAHEPWVELQILTKQSAQAPWQLSFDSGYNGVGTAPPPLLAFDLAPAGPSTSTSGQELYNPIPQQAPPVPTARFLPLLAAYWQSYQDTKHTPAGTDFVRDGYTSGVGERLATRERIYADHRENFRLSADPTAPSWEFSAYGGYPLRCGTIRDVANDTPLKPTGLLYQNADESNYGVPLRAGFYHRITRTTEDETCVYVAAGSLDAVGDNTYHSQVTGALAKKAPAAQKNPNLAKLETDYGVLAYEVGRYQKTLAICEQRHTSGCVRPYALNAGREFALFARRLGTNNFPTSAQRQVDKLAATARQLTLLFGDLATPAPPPTTSSKIAAAIITLEQQYTTLVHKLS
jgi:hypothetical protein